VKTTTIYFEEIMAVDCPECEQRNLGGPVEIAVKKRRPVHCANCQKMFLVERVEELLKRLLKNPFCP
jgi:transposase-like protein